MPSWGEVAQILTSLAAVGAFLLSWNNSHKIKEVHAATNGMAKRLEDAVRAGGELTGEAKGRSDERADERARQHPAA